MDKDILHFLLEVQDNHTTSSESSTSSSKKPSPSKNKERYHPTKILNSRKTDVDFSRKYSSSSKHSTSNDDEDRRRLSQKQISKDKTIGHSKKSSSSSSENHYLSEYEKDRYSPATLTKKDKNADNSVNASSTIARKSRSSSNYEFKKEHTEEHSNNTDNNNNNNRFSLTTAVKNDTEHLLFTSSPKNSNSKGSFSENNKDGYQSSNVRRISTNSFEEFFKNKSSSYSVKDNTNPSSDFWYNRNNRSDPSGSTETKLDSIFRTRTSPTELSFRDKGMYTIVFHRW